jgi:hypothetical protein
LTITAANVIPQTGATIVYSKLAGETIAQGKSLYLDAATGKLKLADSDLSSAAATVVGVALVAASLDQPCPYISLGDVVIGATLVAGKHYFASPTAGGIMPSEDLSTGEYASRIGYAKSTSLLAIDIKNTAVITA